MEISLTEDNTLEGSISTMTSLVKELLQEAALKINEKKFYVELGKFFEQEGLSMELIKKLEKLLTKCKKLTDLSQVTNQIKKVKVECELVKKRQQDLNNIKSQITDKIGENGSEALHLLGKKRENELPAELITKEAKLFNKTYCYVCKDRLIPEEIHFFYGSMCKTCGDLSYGFRDIKSDLTGRYAIVTGGRVKIGYEAVIKLLSYNCFVIATTRFPKDALLRFQKHPQYEKFKHNLRIYPLDLRTFKAIDDFINYIYDNFSHIDILINNAAQTNRRPTIYYKELIETESLEQLQDADDIIIKDHDKYKLPEVDSTTSITSHKQMKSLPSSVILSQVKLIPENEDINMSIKNYDSQPIDFVSKQTWNMEIDEVDFLEFAEVQLINSWAPFYLCQKLKPLMVKSPHPDRYIVNVTAAEGIFNQAKTSAHPHTNMAKAGLNMLTRTVGKHYAKQGIYMTAVDTGWVSYMYDYSLMFTNNKVFSDLYTNIPLDDLDGAMRVLHPVLLGINNKKFLHSCLLRHYKEAEW
jgi:NAD(P)-dependent dehydrogenase (short-subunit alcohol dehydrogenase family)